MSDQPDPAVIAQGRTLARGLEQAFRAGGISQLAQAEAALAESDLVAIDQFREVQLETLVATVEMSTDGADIRWAAAKQAYAQRIGARLGLNP